MCGGVIFPYKDEYRETLARYFPEEAIEEFRQSGQVKSLYWQRGEPLLPVATPDKSGEASDIELVRWGNRDKNAPFPQTGWSRVESLAAGKWNYLRPQPVLIAVSYGIEKGNWFTIAKGIKGVIVQREGERRVYMLTGEAKPGFHAKTHHDRMPLLEDEDDFNWIADPNGIDFASRRSSL
ncbi:MAG: hypothetical protein IVW55_01640 [Chloroflexi bacterium]|nr:hypothetical protein [Chloroflexota bacterium]